MARDWSDLFITDAGAQAGVAPEPASRQRGGLFRRLRESMAKTRQALGSEIHATLFGVLDEHTWERLEEALIMADVGAATTASVVQTLETEAAEGQLEGGQALSERLIELLAATARVGDGRIDIRSQPTVIMAVGVNGTGKTTTIGKLAWHLREQLGRSVLLARRTRSGLRPASSSKAGRNARAARSSPGRRALILAQWRSMRLRRRAQAASTW